MDLRKLRSGWKDETVLVDQAQMAELFQKGRSTITEDLRNIFNEEELEENSVCRKKL